MKKNTNIIVAACLLLYLFPTGSCNKKEALPINVIPVARTIGEYHILNLSDYAIDIKYIPLETNDNVLLGGITQIVYENENILICDRLPPNCYLFNNNGMFCRNIGQLGQGPEDYLSISNLSIFENLICLFDKTKLLIFDTAGNLIERNRVRSDEIQEIYSLHSAWCQMIHLKKDTYIMNGTTMFGTYPTAMLFERDQSELELIKEYPNYITIDKVRGFLSPYELGIMYRFNDEVRIWKIINDTIFTIGRDTEIKDAFIFDFGKYKTTLAYIERKEGANDRDYRNNFITPLTICESLNHLFIRFDFGYQTPEPIEMIGRQYNYFQTYVHCVFDKRTGKLTLMLQPVKGKFGFNNDIDGGPVIWPLYISSENELVSVINPEEFMEYYAINKNPSAELTELANKLKLDDNPIVIIAKLKQ